jgi:hypothetical protein
MPRFIERIQLRWLATILLVALLTLGVGFALGFWLAG